MLSEARPKPMPNRGRANLVPTPKKKTHK